MIERWLLLSLLAALCFGIINFAIKLILGRDFFAANVKTTIFFMAIGILLVFGAYFFLSSSDNLSFPTMNVALLGIFIGIVWAVAEIILFKAVFQGGDVARVIPIINVNTLFAVLFAILLLRELPNPGEALRVVAGALFIIIGSILVAM